MHPRLWMDAFLSLLAPAECLVCGAEPRTGMPLCEPCGNRGRSEPIRTTLRDGTPCVAAWSYDDVMSANIQRLKYQGRPDLAAPLGRVMAEAAVRAGLRADWVVPVPLHPRRLAARGYNQSALLARSVAPTIGARPLLVALTRVRDTPHQARLRPEQRLSNVSDAIFARRPLPAGRIVLVDDVLTTGATARACALAIRGAGGQIDGVLTAAISRGTGGMEPRPARRFPS